MALALLTALTGAGYYAYHHWHGRGRFTADTLYHRQRAKLGFVAFLLGGLVMFVLMIFVGTGR